MTIVEKKSKKYDLLANELGQIYKFWYRFTSYVITWDGMKTNTTKVYQRA